MMQRLLPLSRGPLRGIQSSPITLSAALFPQYGEESTDDGAAMGIFNRDQPWTGLAIIMLIFALDFLLHILFAAWGWTIMFKIIAVEIAIIVHAVGPFALLIGGQRTYANQKIAIQVGFILSIPLSIGYWWAVNGMSWSDWLVLTPLLTLAIHLALWPRQAWLASLLFTDEV